MTKQKDIVLIEARVKRTPNGIVLEPLLTEPQRCVPEAERFLFTDSLCFIVNKRTYKRFAKGKGNVLNAKAVLGIVPVMPGDDLKREADWSIPNS